MQYISKVKIIIKKKSFTSMHFKKTRSTCFEKTCPAVACCSWTGMRVGPVEPGHVVTSVPPGRPDSQASSAPSSKQAINTVRW